MFSFYGIVSHLRTYSNENLKELILDLENADTYEWKIGEVKSGLITNHYLLAYPKK